MRSTVCVLPLEEGSRELHLGGMGVCVCDVSYTNLTLLRNRVLESEIVSEREKERDSLLCLLKSGGGCGRLCVLSLHQRAR